MVPELELVEHASELVELMVPEPELVDHAAELAELMVPELDCWSCSITPLSWCS